MAKCSLCEGTGELYNAGRCGGCGKLNIVATNVMEASATDGAAYFEPTGHAQPTSCLPVSVGKDLGVGIKGCRGQTSLV